MDEIQGSRSIERLEKVQSHAWLPGDEPPVLPTRLYDRVNLLKGPNSDFDISVGFECPILPRHVSAGRKKKDSSYLPALSFSNANHWCFEKFVPFNTRAIRVQG